MADQLPVRATLSGNDTIVEVKVTVRDRVGLTGANLVISIGPAGRDDLVLSLGAAQAAFLAGGLAHRSGVVFGDG